MANNYYYPNQTHFPDGGATTLPLYQTQYRPNVPQTEGGLMSTGGLMTIFVNSEEEVGYYPVAAGVTVLLVSFNLKKFWLKSTGKNGVPEPLRAFSFEEELTQSVDAEFATKEEIRNLNDKIDKLIAELGGVKS